MTTSTFVDRKKVSSKNCSGIYATVEFGVDTTGTLKRSYGLARGAVYVLSVAVAANTDCVTRIQSASEI